MIPEEIDDAAFGEVKLYVQPEPEPVAEPEPEIEEDTWVVQQNNGPPWYIKKSVLVQNIKNLRAKANAVEVPEKPDDEDEELLAAYTIAKDKRKMYLRIARERKAVYNKILKKEKP